jgi:hypothetical protein
MPLSFPIAPSARAALDEEKAARTIAEARELSGKPVTLVSEWLRPTPAEREELQGKADAGVARGFVQLYEDAKGRPVIAVTFWKPQAEGAKAAAKGAGRKSKGRPDPDAPSPPGEDHTDDLYFAKPGSRTRKRKRIGDPNQLDLFSGPDQQGHESRDPHNPFVVIVEEEGDGAAFGLAQERETAGKDTPGKKAPGKDKQGKP